MGLFSIFSKNKQGSTAQDSGRFSRDDDFGAQARAKRASHANESGQGASRRSRSGGDPMLPEKKRARRRLVGAIALALAAAVGLPMLLDSEPRPLAGDIAIEIPSKDKAPALPVPASPVPAADSVDAGEEVIDATPPEKHPGPVAMMTDDAPVYAEPEVRRAAPEPKPAVRKPGPKQEPKPEPKPEAKPEAKPAPKPERKVAEKPVEKPAQKKPDVKPDVKPDATHPKTSEAVRALALLEGKNVAKPPVNKPEAAQRYVVQVAALATQEKVAELQARLRAAGVSSYTQKSGSLIRVRVGPFASREEAEKARARFGGNLVAE